MSTPIFDAVWTRLVTCTKGMHLRFLHRKLSYDSDTPQGLLWDDDDAL